MPAWQLRELLVKHGLAVKNADGSFEQASPLEGHTAVAVMYALLLDAVCHGKIDRRWLKADCA